MQRKTKIAIFLALDTLIMAIALAGFFAWRWAHQAPLAARLLPDSDAVVYINLRPLRLASVFANMPPVSHDPDYEAFIRATGFRFERDLDEAAIAVHLPASSQPVPAAATQPGFAPPETRYSEVFVGRFDLPKVTQYFRGVAKATDSYRGAQIFSVPVEDRTVRVAILSSNLALVSNVDQPQAMEQMIDRARAFHSDGQALVQTLYPQVPFGSLAWAVANPSQPLPLPGGLNIPMPEKTQWIGSVRYAGGVQMELQVLAPDEQSAAQMNESLTALLAIFRALQASAQPKGADPDAKAMFDSLQVQQQGTREVITATVPIGFLKKMASAAQ